MSAIICNLNDTSISLYVNIEISTVNIISTLTILLLNFDLTFHSFLFPHFTKFFIKNFKTMPISKITPLLIQFFVNVTSIKKHMLILVLIALCYIFVSHLSFISSTFHLSSKIYISIICRISIYCISIFTHCRASNA